MKSLLLSKLNGEQQIEREVAAFRQIRDLLTAYIG